ncbi:MBL fold metallo-hydrolase, partial [archaeon]|nr:MBL fold metallo-hydrolase [archaeon]
IDSDYAKKVDNLLKEMDVLVKSIIITHSHGDHFGGNSLILDRNPGCIVYAPKLESTIIKNPIFEPIYLYGASPIEELKNKFFMAQESRVDEIIKEGKFGDLDIINVKGHSMNMIAVATSDNVLYASDSFFPESILNKYKVPYLYDVEDTLNSLNKLQDTNYDFYVLTHGGLRTKEEAKLDIQKNIERINEVNECIVEFLKEKNTVEGVLKYISQKYDLYVTIQQYFLNISIIKAYLSYLKKIGMIECFMDGKMLHWRTK